MMVRCYCHIGYQYALPSESSGESDHTVDVTENSQQNCDEGVKKGISNKEAMENDGMTSDDSIEDNLGKAKFIKA